MNTKDFEQFRNGLSGVYALYGKQLSPFEIEIWWNSLLTYDLAAVVDGFNRHVANPDTGQFAPKPADIIRMLRGSTQDGALRAWAKVDKAIRTVGTYRSVVFDDALIHRVIEDMGGWIALGTKSENEWPFVAKEFENRYRGYTQRSESPTYRPVLAGIAQLSNEQNGMTSQPPAIIGNEQKAVAVLRGGTHEPNIAISQMSDYVPHVQLEDGLKRIA